MLVFKPEIKNITQQINGMGIMLECYQAILQRAFPVQDWSENQERQDESQRQSRFSCRLGLE